MRRYIYHMVRSEADAEDLLQETFVRVSRALPRFRGRATYSTWIHRIATNVCLDFFRRREAGREEVAATLEEAGRLGYEEAGAEAEAPPLTREALFDVSEMGECVRGYVDGLPARLRAVLILRNIEGGQQPRGGSRPRVVRGQGENYPPSCPEPPQGCARRALYLLSRRTQRAALRPATSTGEGRAALQLLIGRESERLPVEGDYLAPASLPHGAGVEEEGGRERCEAPGELKAYPSLLAIAESTVAHDAARKRAHLAPEEAPS